MGARDDGLIPRISMQYMLIVHECPTLRNQEQQLEDSPSSLMSLFTGCQKVLENIVTLSNHKTSLMIAIQTFKHEPSSVIRSYLNFENYI